MVEAWILTIFCLLLAVPMEIAEAIERSKKSERNRTIKNFRYGYGAYVRYVQK